MLQVCKYPGCGSYAINEHKESGLCDKCWWRSRTEGLEKAINEIKEYGESIPDNKLVRLCKNAIKGNYV